MEIPVGFPTGYHVLGVVEPEKDGGYSKTLVYIAGDFRGNFQGIGSTRFIERGFSGGAETEITIRRLMPYRTFQVIEQQKLAATA